MNNEKQDQGAASEGTSESLCSRNWWVEEYGGGTFRIMAGDNRVVMCRGDGYLSREYAKRMGEWMFDHGPHPGPANNMLSVSGERKETNDQH